MAVELEKIKNANVSELDRNVVQILEKAINAGPGISDPAFSPADQIDQLFPSNGSPSEIENFLWRLWELVIQVASAVPFDNAGQQYLVEVIKALRQKNTTTVELWGSESSLWTDLPLLGPCMREAWIEPALDDEQGQSMAASWLNLNSFAARLLGSGSASWTNFALWEFRVALEETGELVGNRVAVATEWIWHSGNELFRHCQKQVELDDATERMLAPGPGFDGVSGFTVQRWEFWKQKLREASEQQSIAADVRSRAGQAVEMMGSIEKGN